VPSILCIEREAAESRLLERSITRAGHRAVLASSMAAGLKALGEEQVDLVITDADLPDGAAAKLVDLLAEDGRRIPIILMTADGGPPAEPRLSQAVGYLKKPLEFEELRRAVDDAFAVCGLARVEPAPHAEESGNEALERIIGESASIRKVLETTRTVAATDATVLIEGESGTGKELLVRAIHQLSARAHRPLVAVNCAALPEGLVESALFGHERGSFTGASTRFVGAFERADKGTLLLDEISELRLDLQAKLLRAIQEQQFERVGGGSPIQVDVRILATSNRGLKNEVIAGRFREDLYYRLRVIPISIPPLRARREDIPPLVQHFVINVATGLGIEPPRVSPAAQAALARMNWPGNVRELEHAVERAVILNREGPLWVEDFGLEEEIAGPTPRPAPRETVAPSRETVGRDVTPATETPAAIDSLNLKDLERWAIERALTRTKGHRGRAALILGISDRTLRNKLSPKHRKDTSWGRDVPAEAEGFSDSETSTSIGPEDWMPHAA
jgi:DNA-binding NtrC family response regulator